MLVRLTGQKSLQCPVCVVEVHRQYVDRVAYADTYEFEM
jgi:hypothetical protein